MYGTAFVTEEKPKLGDFGFAGDDHVVPFEVGPLDIRGRAVQLGPLLDELLGRHDYPEQVAHLLAQACVVTVLLGSSLKFTGKFIFQTRTDGPVDMLVADFTTPGSLRAYARFDAQRLAAAIDKGETAPEQLLGTGVLALTIDQGEYTQRYQGIVPLDGISLEDAAKVYFRQSEQIPTDIRLSVGKQILRGEGGGEHWRAGGVLVQFLPQAPERMLSPDISGGDGDPRDAAEHPHDDAWQEALVLMSTVEAVELVDPTVGPERLLYRLFHEHGVRVFEGTGIVDQCGCSREKIENVLRGFSAEEIEHSMVDGVIKVDCEFCSKSYVFKKQDFS